MTEVEEFRGGVNVVRRIGDTVHRPATAAAPTIHRLLRHVRANGFDGAPEPLGFDPDGNEVLTFLPGEVPAALPPRLRTPELLVSAARLLRRFHDASATFDRTPGDRWQLPARSPAEGRRAALFCRSYGLPADALLLDVVAERLLALIGFIREQARQGNAAFQAHIAAAHIDLYEADLRYLGSNRSAFLRAFDRATG